MLLASHLARDSQLRAGRVYRLGPSAQAPRQAALSFVVDLEARSVVELTYVDKTLHQAALDLLRKRLDKTWSLCDAVSFLLMDHYQAAEPPMAPGARSTRHDPGFRD